MVHNTASWDRLVRVMVGTALLTSFYFMQDTTYWLLIGIVPLVTGWMSYCPLYQLFGFSSCPTAKK